MKISKRIREQAAMICAIAASWPKPIAIKSGLGDLGFVDAAMLLATKAWLHAWNAHGQPTDAKTFGEPYAEAESLLRTGWVPE